MTAIKTWSEQGGESLWRDCPHASYLMALLYGGATIPNAYTWQERERFENAEGLPESQQEQGLILLDILDTAALKLYGVRARDLPESDLSAALFTPGIALALSGQGTGLPRGYIKPHMVCVIPDPNGGLWVYNPLNAMGAGPDHATVAAILAWHRALPNDIRVVREGEFSMVQTQPADPAIGYITLGSDPDICLIVEADRSLIKGVANKAMTVQERAVLQEVLYGRAVGTIVYRCIFNGQRVLALGDNVIVYTPVPSAAGPIKFSLAGVAHPDGTVTLQ